MPSVTKTLDAKRPARGAPAGPVKAPPDLRLLRWVVYVYLALWVFEGALRKWIVPSLANPLLVVRDPVLLLMYALAYAKGVFPKTAFIPWIAGLGALTTFVSLGATQTPMLVTLFGLRANYLHLPLIFLLPEVLRRADLRLIGKYALGVGAGMAGLVLLQFRSPAGGFLNAGAGEGATMLESAFGHIRPSGTFSYTNGLTGFTSLVAGFFLQHLLEKRVYPRPLWLVTIPALLVLVVLSGSRLAAATLALILATVVFISVVQSRYRGSSLKLVVVVGAAVFLAGSFAVFQSGIEVFSSRFQSNNVERGGFMGRYFDGYVQPFRIIEKSEWGGVGLGMGTNVAAGLIKGQRGFMFSEGEGGRVIIENGPVVGMAYLMLRLCITVYLGAQSVRALRLHAATLPLLLFSGCFNDVLLGQFSQATELGYATIAGGLCLTACRAAEEPASEGEDADTREDSEEEKARPPARKISGGGPTRLPPVARTTTAGKTPPSAAGKLPAARGRSAYAARLHGEAQERDERDGA